MENFSRIVAALRVHNRFSQDYVAKKLDLSQSQYSKMESGVKEFPLSKLPALAAVFKIKPAVLLECLLMGIEKPEDAIRKLINEINNRPEHETLPIEKQGQEYKILAAYWEKKYFSLYRQFLKLCEKLGIKRLPKNLGGGGGVMTFFKSHATCVIESIETKIILTRILVSEKLVL